MATSGDDTIDLSGVWEFLPGPATELPDTLPERITVPGLWEAQGYPHLDGEAWYRTWFDLPADAADQHWRLEFGAVMDTADVRVNGTHVGSHSLAFTPFAFEVRDAVRPGRNRLDVRVVDHPLGGHAHTRTAHGKQGWANEVFPSPPSLYLTYGGIWQPVTLHRHAAVTVDDVHVTTDLHTATVTVALRNSTSASTEVTVAVDVFGVRTERTVTADPGVTPDLRFTAAVGTATRWTPDNPVLHTAHVEVTADEVDSRAVRFGVRMFEVDGERFLLNGRPFPIRAALVQGFRADTLYAEGDRAQIEAEVRAARQAGLNTLRLHIKAFDPVYLDVCDELGMLVHADIPVAEPIAHAELGATGELAEHCAAAVSAQIRRDRNHPCVVLWSLMNELGVDDPSARHTPGYAAFVRLLYDTAVAADPSRPIIENDWIAPDPDEIYRSPIRTAHWYGRLSEAYLTDLRAKVHPWTGRGRPLYLSEFGDWGLPEPTASDAFWSPDESFRDTIAGLPWTGTDFLRQTQRYQGISDRLQVELFRTEGLAGWCVTELTDVPHEYNGLWSVTREPKTPAIEQLRTACQDVLPICARTNWTFPAEHTVDLDLYVSNESGERIHGELVVAVDGTPVRTVPVQASPFSVAAVPVSVTMPAAGEHRLELAVTDGSVRGASSYPLHVTRPGLVSALADIVGTDRTRSLLAGAGIPASPGARLLVVGEGCLDDEAGARVRDALAARRTVIVLRQPVDAAARMPVDAAAADVATAWGSTPFLFTGPATLPSLPANTVLSTQLMGVVPDVVWTRLGTDTFATDTLVGLWKPAPDAIRGTVLGRVGRLWVCQLRLEAGDREPNRTAITVLTDLVRATLQDE